MDSSLEVLLALAVGIGFTHTLIGVDHTLPFVVLGRAQGWSLGRTMGLTALCGVGHVLSSVLLGVLGLALGVAVGHLEWVEGARGSVASWALILFGLTYAAWSFSQERRQQRHAHDHGDGRAHVHRHPGPHHHFGPALRVVDRPDRHFAVLAPPPAPARKGLEPRVLTAWGLFLVFVLGPCEPLIPLLMVPALQQSAWATALVAFTFGAVTLSTMMALVALGYFGLGLARFHGLETRANTLAGLAIAASGVAIMVFGS